MVGKISHGFSPPSIAEIRPSTGILDLNLKSENGWNQEIIYRGKLKTFPMDWTINLYHFNLNETIAIRTAADGGDYYGNVGSSIQKGLEANLRYSGHRNTSLISLTLQDAKFRESGKFIPGIAKKSLFLTEILKLTDRINWSFQMQYNGKMYLNDANTAEFPKLDYGWKIKDLKFNTWLFIDNIFNLTYTLGPDLNAFGDRFYNVAPGRNISIGTKLRI